MCPDMVGNSSNVFRPNFCNCLAAYTLLLYISALPYFQIDFIPILLIFFFSQCSQQKKCVFQDEDDHPKACEHNIL